MTAAAAVTTPVTAALWGLPDCDCVCVCVCVCRQWLSMHTHTHSNWLSGKSQRVKQSNSHRVWVGHSQVSEWQTKTTVGQHSSSHTVLGPPCGHLDWPIKGPKRRRSRGKKRGKTVGAKGNWQGKFCSRWAKKRAFFSSFSSRKVCVKLQVFSGKKGYLPFVSKLFQR